MLAAPPFLPFAWLYYGLTLAVLAWVVCVPLTEAGMIFSPWAQVLERLPAWIGKPLGLCEECFGGQLAFWSFAYWNYGRLNLVYTEWALFVAWTIFCISIIGKTTAKWS